MSEIADEQVEQELDDGGEWDDRDLDCCPACDGEGFIVVCCDDICVGGGHCIHGDGEDVCPECEGSGFV